MAGMNFLLILNIGQVHHKIVESTKERMYLSLNDRQSIEIIKRYIKAIQLLLKRCGSLRYRFKRISRKFCLIFFSVYLLIFWSYAQLNLCFLSICCAKLICQRFIYFIILFAEGTLDIYVFHISSNLLMSAFVLNIFYYLFISSISFSY